VRRRRRLNRIESYAFPPALARKLTERDPELSADRAGAAVEELRAWFLAYAQGTPMPSPNGAVDAAWREFILMTKLYRDFCDKGFGGYLHYPPD
jgi:hypothetical protein